MYNIMNKRERYIHTVLDIHTLGVQAAVQTKFVTCSEKRDHSGYFIKIEFLAWIDSFMCAESNGTSFMKKY